MQTSELYRTKHFMKENKNHLILLAGGSGTRFGANIPKQFVLVDGQPIIIHTLKKMMNDLIDDITIVCVEPYISYLRDELDKNNFDKKITIISGGKSGHQSIYLGLKEVNKHSLPDDLVIIHDSVRPFITYDILKDAIETASKYGTGCASLPTIEGLVIKSNDLYGTSVADRYNIMRIQTPQAYRFSLIKGLYDEADSKGIEYPYADGICLSNNVPIYFSKSISANIKITTKSDIVFMKSFIHFTDKELMEGNE